MSSAALVFVCLATGCVEPLALPGRTNAAPAGSLVFDEGFAGPAGAPADPKRWRPETGGTGWGNNELQFYTDGANTFLDGQGNLVIEARKSDDEHTCWYGSCRYTSGKLVTKGSFSQRYGRFEARMKVPAGRGLWAAFWLLGDNIDDVGHPLCGEIDVMETLGHQPGKIQQHAQGPHLRYGGGHLLPAGQEISDWHTYAVDWTPESITWLIDDVATLTLTKEQAERSWVFDHPFYLLLNLAVGGDWPGSPDSETVFPAKLLVDYVRVYAP